MIFGLKLYNTLLIDVKDMTNIKYFRKLVKRLLQICPYNLDQGRAKVAHCVPAW